MRARDLGISIGLLAPGPLNAITDVAGVRVGHATIIAGEAGPLVAGQGPVRTGVTVVCPSMVIPSARASSPVPIDSTATAS